MKTKQKLTKQKLTNVFHSTEAIVLVEAKTPEGAWLEINAPLSSARRLSRVRAKLCGFPLCQCGTFRPR